MIGKVFRRNHEFFVGLTLNGIPHDEAGPFDDDHDAVMAARRMVGAENVRFGYGNLGVVDRSEDDTREFFQGAA